MKVIIQSATGSSKVEALLDKDSGVIEFKDGEISHILHEKQFNKKIFVVKDAPKEPITKEEFKAISEEQSPAKKVKQTKSK